MTITGTESGDIKFKVLQEEHWEWHDSTITHCKKHNTSFNQNEEPCWQCYNECQEKKQI